MDVNTIGSIGSQKLAARPQVASGTAGAPGAMGGDALVRSVPPIQVVTFNTAVGASAIKTPQASFLELPMYRRVLEGAADAPIMGIQEGGRAQLKALQKAASDSGNFAVRAERVGIRQWNITLVPKRFKVLESHSHYFSGRLHRILGGLKDRLLHGRRQNWLQLFEHRGYQELKLFDTATGKPLTFMNTHVSYVPAIRKEQVPELTKAVLEARKQGPVLLVGDFNTATRDTNTRHEQAVEDVWQALDATGLRDMGPLGWEGVSSPHCEANIDHVLAIGFESGAQRMYKGNDLSLPGQPTAETISDHYAEEDSVSYDQ